MILVALCPQPAEDTLQQHALRELAQFPPLDDTRDDGHWRPRLRLLHQLAVEKCNPRQGFKHASVCPIITALRDHLWIDGEPSLTEKLFLEVLAVPRRIVLE